MLKGLDQRKRNRVVLEIFSMARTHGLAHKAEVPRSAIKETKGCKFLMKVDKKRVMKKIHLDL